MEVDIEEILLNFRFSEGEEEFNKAKQALKQLILEACNKPFKTGDGLEDDEEMEDTVELAFARQEIKARIEDIFDGRE